MPALIKFKCALVISSGAVRINSPVQSDVLNLLPFNSRAVDNPPSSVFTSKFYPQPYLFTHFSFRYFCKEAFCLIYLVNRRELIKLINFKASDLGLPRVKIKHGGSHDKLIILNLRVPIPRHKEISS